MESAPAIGFDWAGSYFTSTLRNDMYDFIDPKKVDLSGKVVLITGASRGVGKAMAIAYAQGGASGIILAARSSLDEVAEACAAAAKDNGRSTPRVSTIKMDTTSRHDVEAAAEQVAKDFGKVDILINNAGYMETYSRVAESDPDEWWKTFEVNVKGTYLVSRSFIPLVLKSEHKTIVQISSVGAHIVGYGGSGYQTTKQTILRFNNFLNLEYGEEGLLAYGVHPGAVMTELANKLPDGYHAMLNDTAELCGATVLWLTSEKRNWLADRYVSVTWDMEEFLSKKDEIVERDLLKVRMRL